MMEGKICIKCLIDKLSDSFRKGRNQCKDCARGYPLKSKEQKKTRLKSIEWFIGKANVLHLEKYDYSTSIYLGMHVKLEIICREHGSFWQTPHNHLKGQNCPQCGSRIQKIKIASLKIGNDKMDLFLISNNRNIRRIGDYIDSKTNIEWLCIMCNNKWFTTPSNIKNQNHGCPKCNDTRLNNNDIDKFLLEYFLPIERLDEYINSYTKINWKCLTCSNIWLAQPCEITRLGSRSGSGCPQCARGKNEKIVGLTLKDLNIQVEKLRIDLPTKQKLFPDFFLPDIKTIVEYNGIQHYQPTCFGSQSKIDAEICFEKQKLRDEEMRKYCQNNGIQLLEIDGRKYKGDRLKKFVIEFFENGLNYG